MIMVARSEALKEAPALGGFPLYLSLYGISLYITTAGFAHSNRRICTFQPQDLHIPPAPERSRK